MLMRHLSTKLRQKVPMTVSLRLLVGDYRGDSDNDFAVSAPYYMPDPNNGISDGKVYVWLSE